MMFARSIRAFVCALVALGATAVMARAEDLCVPKTVSALMARRNRLSWRNDRADLVCSGHPGFAVQVEEPA